ncbi:hypothetical protein BV898_04074 [Hypsibius exemplaris]|uniref:L-dopachrome isomerase n=1 Tax=Hypsibius exemplaris TaxID=2072580 RepID=A0A1W0X379_HYPEX|nr:hypothetical protein BV898_04074 [Hypsibius exemplaris]
MGQQQKARQWLLWLELCAASLMQIPDCKPLGRCFAHPALVRLGLPHLTQPFIFINDQMPLFIIDTNLPRSKIPKTFTADAAELIATITRREKNHVGVLVNTDLILSVGGSEEPAAMGKLQAIKRLGGERNNQYTAPIYEFIEKTLGIKGDRFVLEFQAIQGSEIALGGKTLADYPE